MGICISLRWLPATANQPKPGERFNKFSEPFTERQEPSEGWVINAYLSDPSYGDFPLIAWGPPLFALRRAKRALSVKTRRERKDADEVFEGLCWFIWCVFSKRVRKALLCVFGTPWANVLWACHGVLAAEHTVGPVSCAIELKITGLHSHTICSVCCKCQAAFPQRGGFHSLRVLRAHLFVQSEKWTNKPGGQAYIVGLLYNTDVRGIFVWMMLETFMGKYTENPALFEFLLVARRALVKQRSRVWLSMGSNANICTLWIKAPVKCI